MDINDEIRERLWIAHAQLRRFKLSDDPDAESFAYEAVYKAILTFNSDGGASLDTYATCVVANKLRQYLRSKQKKRQIHTISLYEPVDETGELLLIDVVPSTTTAEDIIHAKDMRAALNNAMTMILSEASQNYQDVIQIWYSSDCTATQKEIADYVGISQAAVSRIIGNFKCKLKTELEEYL